MHTSRSIQWESPIPHHASLQPNPTIRRTGKGQSGRQLSYISHFYHTSLPNFYYQGLAHPPATSTHSAKQEPCLPSTSTISVSHLHLHPTPFSLTVSHESQYSSSSFRFFSSVVV